MNLPPDISKWDPRFYPSPFRLRFELGGETFGTDQPVPRFVQAFGRARQVAREAFEGSKCVFGIAAAWENSHDDLFAPADDGFVALQDAGFSLEPLREWEAPLWPDEPLEEDRVRARWRAFDVSDDFAARDVLMWLQVAHEMRVTPRAPILSYLVDFDRGIILYVYDDRGMDLTAMQPDTLRDLYTARSEWLLDYDRPRMKEAFG